LVTLNYGKSVHATEETIETEAVNHFAPGERILSLGNIGCMLNCAYCHNWKTSQAKYVADKDVYYYTPEAIVETATRHGIRCLSWTYNDPVVWHEFVRDTAALAHEAGLINLYKSAFYITAEAVEELLPCMDIFSVSVKSMDPDYYVKLTKGQLQPVLDAAKQVYHSGRHLEISNLMITDVSDDEESAGRIADWVLGNLGPEVPVHYVRFHPDYKMRNTVRTPVSRLVRAREMGLERGLEHVYLGNVYDTPWSNTYCNGCGDLLVTRYGLNARVVGLDDRGHCLACGRDAHFKLLPTRPPGPEIEDPNVTDLVSRSFDWHGDIRSLHVQMVNTGAAPSLAYHRRRYTVRRAGPWNSIRLLPGESYRIILAKSSEDEVGPEVAVPAAVHTNLHEVFDRAHFPTVSIEEGTAKTDVTPLPLFPGGQMTYQRTALPVT
jgi:pyruvate formate lyase activating enzyme